MRVVRFSHIIFFLSTRDHETYRAGHRCMQDGEMSVSDMHFLKQKFRFRHRGHGLRRKTASEDGEPEAGRRDCSER